MSFTQSVKNFFREKESCFGVVKKVRFSDKIDYEVTLITDEGIEEVFLIEDRHQTIVEGMKLYIKFFFNPDSTIQTHIVKWMVCNKKAKAEFFLKFTGATLLIFISYKVLKISFGFLSILLYLLASKGFTSPQGVIILCLFTILTGLMFFITVEQVKLSKNSFSRFTESLKRNSKYKVISDDQFEPPYNTKKVIKYIGVLACLALFASLFFTAQPVSKGQSVSLEEKTEVAKPQTI